MRSFVALLKALFVKRHSAARLADLEAAQRRAAVETLGKLEPGALAQHSAALVARLLDSNADVRQAVVQTLGKLEPGALAQHCAALLAMFERDSDAGVRQAVVQTLGKGDRRRLVKELEDLSAIFAVHPTDLDRWTVWLMGPAEGPYSAGVWELSVTIPPEYPMSPPTFRFVTPIYHPLVCQTSGKVAWLLDDWSPALGIRVLLYTLHVMIADYNAVEPCSWSGSKLMQSLTLASDRADYDRVARKWTLAHAVGAAHLRRCSFFPAIRRRALYLTWVARQLAALHGLPASALLDPWVEFVVPLCVLVPDKTLGPLMAKGTPDC
jgi:peroxin-4